MSPVGQFYSGELLHGINLIQCLTCSQPSANVTRHIYMNMNCDPGSAATGTWSNKGTQCDTRSVMRCSAQSDLLSEVRDYGRGAKMAEAASLL